MILNRISSYSYYNLNKINIPQKYTSVKKGLTPFQLLNFTGFKCSEGNFKIKTLKNLRCPICDLLMLSDKQQRIFARDISSKKGEALASSLEKYQDESIFETNPKKSKKKTIFRPQRQKVVEILIDLARNNPDLSLSELVKLKAQTSLKDLIVKQMVIVDELEEYIQNADLDKEELKNIQTTIDEFVAEIQGISEIQFKRTNFVNALSNVTQNPKKQEKITEIITKLPTSSTEVNSFFVKFANNNRTDEEIAARLVLQSSPTTEHLIPKSKGGPDDTRNYICDCQDCNSGRGNLTFHDWMETIPNIKANLEEYLQTIQNAIDNNKLPENYADYTSDIIKKINKISKRKIELKAPESVTDKNTSCKLKSRRRKIKQLKEKIIRLSEYSKSLPKDEKIILSDSISALGKILHKLDKYETMSDFEFNELIREGNQI